MPKALLTDRLYRIMLCAGLLAGGCAAIGYGLFIATWSHNLPFSDDYRDILGFIQCMDNHTSLAGQTGCLFAKNNSHVTLTNHIAYWAQFSLLGHINFQFLQWMGNLQIPLLAIVLYAALKKHLNDRPLLLALIVLSLFQIQWWEAALWAMTSLSNFSVIVFSFASIYCLVLPASKVRVAACIALALLASWSQINGLLVWPILLLHWMNSGKPGLSVFLRLAPFIALACLPFLLIPTDDSAARVWDATRTLPALLLAPVSTAALLGSAIGLDHQRTALSLIAGVPLTAYAVNVLFKGRRLPFDFLTGAMLFILGSAFMIAVGRYGFGHMELVMQSRYKPYPVLLLLLLAVHYLSHRQASASFKSIAAFMLVFFIALNAGSWLANTVHTQHRIERHRDSNEIWLMSGNAEHLGYSILFIDNADDYIKYAIKAGTYRPLSWLSAKNHPLAIEHAQCPTTTVHRRAEVITYRNTLLDTQSFEIQTWAWGSTIMAPPSLLLCSETGSYRLALDEVHWVKTNIAEMRRAKIFIKPLTHGQMPIAPGRYRILVENPANPQEVWGGESPAWISIPEKE